MENTFNPIQDLPDNVVFNLLQYLPDQSIASMMGSSVLTNTELGKLTSENNFYWITRLEKLFSTTADETVRDTVKDIDLERVYKNIVALEEDGEVNIILHLTDIDTAKVVLLFKPYAFEYLIKELTDAASNGYYELVQLLIDTI